MPDLQRPFLIAVTGGIASGKTTTAQWFAAKGYQVYFADEIAHQILDEPEVKKKVVRIFGKNILIGKEIDRSKLAEIVFTDDSARLKLNEIIHPKVRQKMQEYILLADSDMLIFEIPLLFENNLQSAFDLTINIQADEDIQINRLSKRDKLCSNAVIQRLRAQMPGIDKQKLADLNISNNGTEEELYNKLNSLFPLIRKLKKKEIVSLLAIGR